METSRKNEEMMESTVEPGVSMSAVEEAPTLPVGTIVAVTLVVFIAIAAVFLLGVLLDFRQQRLLEKKMEEVKRSSRRVTKRTESGGEGAHIAECMEETDVSVPPAAALQHIP